MIKNFEQHKLNIDFSQIKCSKGRPSDIDMFYFGGKYLILGEIKNELGTFTTEQRHLYENLAQIVKTKDVYILYITHNKYVEKGDTTVNVAQAKVSEYYFKKRGENGRWVKPKKYTNVQQAFDFIERFYIPPIL